MVLEYAPTGQKQEVQRGSLVPIGRALGSLDGPERAIRDVSPQALHHLIQVDQISPTLEHAS